MFDFIGSVADIRDYVKRIELSEIRLEERSEMIDFYKSLIGKTGELRTKYGQERCEKCNDVSLRYLASIDLEPNRTSHLYRCEICDKIDIEV